MAPAGLQGCGVDTVNGALGSEFGIDFVVFDRDRPPATTSLRQSIIVTSPCSSSQTYCPGKAATCGVGPCSLRADAEPPAVRPDIVVNVSAATPFPVTWSNVSQDGRQAEVLQLYGVCGHKLAVDLAICGAAPAPGLVNTSQRGNQDCLLTVLQDPQATAPSSIVTATNSPQCSYSSSSAALCFLCSIKAASDGACIASQQQFELLAVDPQGSPGTPLQLGISIAQRCSLVETEFVAQLTAASREALGAVLDAGPHVPRSSPTAGALHNLLMQHVFSAPACSGVALLGPVLHVELHPRLAVIGGAVQAEAGIAANVSIKATVALGVQNGTGTDPGACHACMASLGQADVSGAPLVVDLSGVEPSTAWLTSLRLASMAPQPHECPVTVAEAVQLTLSTGLWNLEATIAQLALQVLPLCWRDASVERPRTRLGHADCSDGGLSTLADAFSCVCASVTAIVLCS